MIRSRQLLRESDRPLPHRSIACAAAPHRPRQRQGFFLLVVIVVVAIATLAVYTFTETMVVMDDAAHLQNDVAQTNECVQSAGAMLRVLLSQTPDQRVESGGLYNNPQFFQAVPIAVTDNNPYFFTVVAPGLNEVGMQAGIRFGLIDESSRLNLNTLAVLDRNNDLLAPAMMAMVDAESADEVDNVAVNLLLALPNMTRDVAEAILDWIDEDDDPREFGAESESYEILPTPYSCANGPITSVDELLLVRGVTPSLLFGADSNRNGVLDADEQQRFNVTIDTPGALGWAAYLTVHGSEANLQRNGNPRINVNTPDMEALYDQLSGAMEETYASYVVAYRISGTSASGGISGAADAQDGDGDDENQNADQAQDAGFWTADLINEMDLTGGGGTELSQILDLIDSTVTIGTGEDAKRFTSPFPSDPIAMSVYLPILMDVLSTSDNDRMPGRINVNTCPVELLYGIPMLDEETITSIVENRDPTSDDPNRYYATWLLADGLVPVETMRLLTPLLCGGGSVFRAQTVGYNADGGAFTRAEIILDAHTVNPKIISFRNFSHLGRGFDLSVLGRRAIVAQ